MFTMDRRIMQIVFLLFPLCVFAQENEAAGKQDVPYVSLILGGFVLLILLLGILIQARWKEK